MTRVLNTYTNTQNTDELMTHLSSPIHISRYSLSSTNGRAIICSVKWAGQNNQYTCHLSITAICCGLCSADRIIMDNCSGAQANSAGIQCNAGSTVRQCTGQGARAVGRTTGLSHVNDASVQCLSWQTAVEQVHMCM